MRKEENMHRLPALLLPWYAQSARAFPWRADAAPYRVWVSEIMLQQTRAEVVIAYFTRFIAALPTVQALADCPEEQLLKLWEGLGYYSRVRNLQKTAQIVVREHGGALPISADALRRLPGIGDYTAGAIASICHDAATPAVDGNVLRIFARLTADTRPVSDTSFKKECTRTLLAVYEKHLPAGQRGALTQALMELGRTVCTPGARPHCDTCPVRPLCLAAARDIAGTLPVKIPKKPRREEERTIFLCHCRGKIALRRREDTGVLRGMWGLPDLPGTLAENDMLAAAEALGFAVRALRSITHHEHIFTHIHWRMTLCTLDVDAIPADCTLFAPDALPALPSAFGKLI
jgi:A/G-specific adenine glycosylase